MFYMSFQALMVKDSRDSPDKTLGTVHGNGPDCVLSEVLGHLKDELGLPANDGEGIEDLWEAFIELDVHNGTNDRDNLALVSVNSGSHRELALWQRKV